MIPATPELSGRARRDLDEIRDWTIQTWGAAQWQASYRGIGSGLRRIVSDPTCGRPQDKLAKGMRALAYERHLIFFAPVASYGGQPVVLRILHQSRNLEAMTYFDRL